MGHSPEKEFFCWIWFAVNFQWEINAQCSYFESKMFGLPKIQQIIKIFGLCKLRKLFNCWLRKLNILHDVFRACEKNTVAEVSVIFYGVDCIRQTNNLKLMAFMIYNFTGGYSLETLYESILTLHMQEKLLCELVKA